MLLCLFVLLSCTIVVYGEDAVYSTVGGTWVKLTDTTYVMDTDGDGNYDVTLTKNGNNWVYSFVVADDTPQYYVYEDNIPSGYEIEGEGSRANPTLTSGGSVRYNHTPNVSDDGTQDGYYDNSLSYMEVVRLPGATSLDVEITYQTESANYDYVCIWTGDRSNWTPVYYSQSVTGRLGGKTKTTSNYTIEGDTLTIGFKSDNSVNNFYGYYAVITGVGMSGGNQAVITNKAKDTVDRGGFELAKQCVGSDEIRNFGFDIFLSSEDDRLSEYLEGSHNFGEVSFADGKATVYLKNGEKVALSDIPVGVKYSITEKNADDYTVSWQDDSVGDAFSGVVEGTDVVSVVCTNTKTDVTDDRPVTSVTVKKSFLGHVSGSFDFMLCVGGLVPDMAYVFGGQSVVSIVGDMRLLGRVSAVGFSVFAG